MARTGRGGVTWKGLVAGTALTILLLVAVGAVVVLTGAYDVAASTRDGGLSGAIIHGTMENSVRRQARAIQAPQRFTETQVMAGAGHYKEMCQQCHAGPGVERAEFAQGLNPRPPRLGPELEEWQPRDVFWIVKNGIRMSAMPAFGSTHSDADIWNIVAFVEQLPEMTPAAYRAFPSEEAEEREGHEAHHHHH